VEVTASAPTPAGSRFPFPSYPIGWFRVADSADLRPGDVRPLRYFGLDLVLFRTRDGAAHVLDAHCPHLGAHRGVGGRVAGNTLECPFHGWRFDGSGRCVQAAMSEKVPKLGESDGWPIIERNAVILVWYHPERKPPFWERKELPESLSDEWAPFSPSWEWRIRTHCQEVCENGMDLVHFPHLHSQQTRSIESVALDIEGHTLVHRTHQEFNLFGIAKLLTDRVHGPLDMSLEGLGCLDLRAVVHAKIDLAYMFTFYLTPIDQEHIHMRSLVTMKKTGGRLATWLLMRKASREGRRIIDQDVPIWEGKDYLARPGLAEDGGPIMRFRHWARQFYGS
jgi:3-ketosteroid 9alpha-monooxygenase subunit A